MPLNYAGDLDDLEPLERGQPSGRFVFSRYARVAREQTTSWIKELLPGRNNPPPGH